METWNMFFLRPLSSICCRGNILVQEHCFPEGPPEGPLEGPPAHPRGPGAPGPSRAQAGPKPDFWKFGNLGPGNLGSKKNKKIKILKIKIRVVQNVGKVWISRKKKLPAPFGAIPGIFLRGPETTRKKTTFVRPFLLFYRFGALAAIHPRWGNR